MSRAFGGPGKYIQGRDQIHSLTRYACTLGDRCLVLVTRSSQSRLPPSIWTQFTEHGAKIEYFAGECHRPEVDRLAAVARASAIDVVVAIGGGKIIDTGKAVAMAANTAMIAVPTIASTDAPCSAISILYDENGGIDRVLALPNNPELVLVDTSLIVEAPIRFLVAGMGDALSTWFEARSNADTRNNNIIGAGYPPTLAGMAIARTCHEVLLRDGLAAKSAAEQGYCTAAVENIIEVNTLLSGIGFENCGSAGAHALNDGLAVLEETHHLLHGEKVAFGTLCMLVLEGRDPMEVEQTLRFCRALGLPVTLAEIGIKSDTEAKVRRVAEATLAAPGRLIHRTAAHVDIATIADAVLGLDAISNAL